MIPKFSQSMKTPFLTMLCAAALAVFPPQAEACTRAVYLGPDGMTVTGRTMDWREDPLTNLYIFPRGVVRRGANTDKTVLWTSKYGSLSAAESEPSKWMLPWPALKVGPE